MHGFGKGKLCVAGHELPVGHHPNELLGVQRISTRALQQRRLGVGRQNRALEERSDEPGRLLVVERRQREREGVRLSSSPARPAREKLGAGRADDEDRNSAGPVDEVIDEVEEPLVGPVQVLEHEHERPLVRDRLEEAPPGRERLRAVVAAQLLLGLEPDQRSEMALDPVGFGVVDQPANTAVELGRGLFRRVRLQDS